MTEEKIVTMIVILVLLVVLMFIEISALFCLKNGMSIELGILLILGSLSVVTLNGTVRMMTQIQDAPRTQAQALSNILLVNFSQEFEKVALWGSMASLISVDVIGFLLIFNIDKTDEG